MTSSPSQFELKSQISQINGGINRVHEGFHLRSDVKKKMIPIFSAFINNISSVHEDLVAEPRVALDENEQEFQEFLSEVRFYVAFKLHDIDENS